MNDTTRQDDEAAAHAAGSQLVRDFGLLIKAATRLEQLIDTAVRRECGISHTMLEVLLRLCRRPGEEVSQRQLAEDLTLTSSGTTRLIDRMEEAGLVRRLPSPGDRRSVLVEPTEQGRAVFLRAAEVHARVVQRYFVDPLDAEHYARLTHALGEINSVLREDTG
ncbi:MULTISPECIES: MarR family winged helix-turn-helix transcriptional regulator [Streptomyces]|uniref:MarR family transcriptional regulator n=1 Tax=Streptomyces caniscabiei TaxID=2746961 RepID=A0ABU4MV40_9ACTN|nr:MULTISPECIES: MarR family transcriptional regulator [Streptomyces]MBE4733441.1 MarR family transcriptional regulator [Streptomyces caniscabiei]MBE4754619.1 MarR family transcriptional regulator [Streptomyces caniscabiei]MBE4768560.1 MarR family transcriptional regulator [Streptomyces caniscabiei]MBE4781936.1 MarR family transcriptional regulator [Streptomyces caniscabiei]MBE4793226.1 MarR family transcriptional regulator [Streptomyces caniscabiei]